MMVNGRYHYICIVPIEWQIYSKDDLEIFIYKCMRNHFNKHGEIRGTEITIGETTIKTEYWNLKLWLKRTSDRNYSKPEGYFWMLLDWRSRPDPVS